MSILDDAIREHLELKRAHGADDHELKKLEDEAFGPPQRPDEIDPFAEAPTEFLTSPGEEPAEVPEIGDEAARSGRRPDITDLQETPPAPSFFDAEAPAPPVDELAPAPDAPPPSPADAASIPLPPPPGEAPVDLAPPPADLAPPAAEPTPQADVATPPAAEPTPPAAEEHPAGEHAIVPDSGHNTEERHAIADQPTQMFDVQAHVDAEAEAAAPAEQASPTDEELVDAAQDEPHAAPPAPAEPATPFVPPTEDHEQPPLATRGPDAEVAGHPPTEADPEEESAEYDFFNEQRLADELDQALEAPIVDQPGLSPLEDAGPAEGGGGIFDFESHASYEEDPSEEVLRRADARELGGEAPSEELPLDATVEAPLPTPEPGSEPPSTETPRGFVEPPSEELTPLPEPPSEELTPLPEPPSEELTPLPEPPSEETPSASAGPDADKDDYAFDPDTGHEDVLEDTPRFLEDAPEDDDLWFEQKPPKDFDLD
jgi:hypothetical protein